MRENFQKLKADVDEIQVLMPQGNQVVTEISKLDTIVTGVEMSDRCSRHVGLILRLSAEDHERLKVMMALGPVFVRTAGDER